MLKKNRLSYLFLFNIFFHEEIPGQYVRKGADQGMKDENSKKRKTEDVTELCETSKKSKIVFYLLFLFAFYFIT